MKMETPMNRYLLLTLAPITFSGPTMTAQTIVLIQVPCQFLDVEADQGFKTSKKADFDAINASTAEQHLQKTNVLQLKSGDYVFR
jgi:hypothetical protein